MFIPYLAEQVQIRSQMTSKGLSLLLLVVWYSPTFSLSFLRSVVVMSAAPKHPLGTLKVGDVATYERVMKPEYTQLYADITGDANPLHFDEEYAKSTRFDGLVCHGGLAAGMLNALVAEEMPGPGSVFMKQELEYTSPTRPGDTLVASGRVSWVHESKPVCHMDVSVKVKASDTEVLKGKVVVYRMLPKT